MPPNKNSQHQNSRVSCQYAKTRDETRLKCDSATSNLEITIILTDVYLQRGARIPDTLCLRNTTKQKR